MPMPKVYIIPEDTPNAFATGRNEEHAVVAVTEGILRILAGRRWKASWPTSGRTSRTRTC